MAPGQRSAALVMTPQEKASISKEYGTRSETGILANAKHMQRPLKTEF